MEQRYEVNWTSTGERFVGHANDLDVWVEFPNAINSFTIPIILVVGPKELVKDDAELSHTNYDVYEPHDGALEYRESQDIVTTPHDMCLIYQIAHEQGIFTWTKD
jgi:hypothetical protein